MAAGPMSRVICHLRRAALRQDDGGVSDGQLLHGFLTRREEAAFEALLRRHGPMVLGCCRRILANAQDAEDAFQATFLVLVRKSASLRLRTTVGNWLYGVAYHTALKARAANFKRRAKEKQMRDLPTPEALTDDTWRELQPRLDEELHRLPDKYREPVVLCDLEGKTRREAAQQLGVPIGTLSGRLTTARRLLARRLARHGLSVSGGALAVALSQSAASASVPAALFNSTIKAATLVAAGTAAAGVVSAKVAALTQGALKTMFLSKLKTATVWLLVLGLVGSGAGVLTLRALADKPSKPGESEKQKAADDKKAAPADQKEKDGEKKKDADKPQKQPDLSGQIAAVAEDGKNITLSIPSKIKGEDPTSIVVKLTDKTRFTYFGVEANLQTPTVGYVALIWLAEGSQDTAASIRLGLKDGGPAHDLSGVITAVSADAKTITLELQPENKGDPAKKIEIKLTDKTKFSYFGVDQTGETPTVGYSVLVWLVKGSKDTASGVRLGVKN